MLGLSLLGHSARAQEPAPISLPPVNLHQALANTIVGQLRQSATLRQYTVAVNVRGSDVEVTGAVTDASQRDEVIRLVQGVPGVAKVIDKVTIAGQTAVLVPVQNPTLPVPGEGADKKAEKKGSESGKGNGPLPEPTPMFGGALPGHAQLNPPAMPPYAWPTYAPYNNFSRVGTPEAYPWQSWPFIGPMYPFPKVPLGWRSVKLEFDDGYWWYGQVGNKYNWWKIRYW